MSRRDLGIYTVTALPPASERTLGSLYRVRDAGADDTYHVTLRTSLGAHAWIELGDAADLAAHEADTTVHGATGAVVGTTNVQTLTNKTLTSPTIADFTNAGHDHADADDGGQVAHTALTAIGTNTHAQIDTALTSAASHAAATAAHGATGAVVGTTNTQTLADKTLTTPTIAATGFTNAQHNHSAADRGGQITDAALSAAVGIAKGGTGATTAAAALTNLGLTATAAELNALDGITATVAELNFTDGVTSAIQTQLDGKQPLDADLTTLAAAITAAGHALVDDASAADQRTTLGLVAGGAGDIWVEKAGDTMTGQLGLNGGARLTNSTVVEGVKNAGTDFNLLYVDAGDAVKFGGVDGGSGVTLELWAAGARAVTIGTDGTLTLLNGVTIRTGTGSPEGVVTANPGSTYHSTDGNVYRKGSGTGNTGWTAM